MCRLSGSSVQEPSVNHLHDVITCTVPVFFFFLHLLLLLLRMRCVHCVFLREIIEQLMAIVLGIFCLEKRYQALLQICIEKVSAQQKFRGVPSKPTGSHYTKTALKIRMFNCRMTFSVFFLTATDPLKQYIRNESKFLYLICLGRLSNAVNI